MTTHTTLQLITDIFYIIPVRALTVIQASHFWFKLIIYIIFCGKPQQATVCWVYVVKNPEYYFNLVSVSLLNGCCFSRCDRCWLFQVCLWAVNERLMSRLCWPCDVKTHTCSLTFVLHRRLTSPAEPYQMCSAKLPNTCSLTQVKTWTKWIKIIALQHLFTNGSSAVNGCHQNKSPNSW